MGVWFLFRNGADRQRPAGQSRAYGFEFANMSRCYAGVGVGSEVWKERAGQNGGGGYTYVQEPALWGEGGGGGDTVDTAVLLLL